MQMPLDIGTFHIIGIGGIGMSAIAEILLAKGYTVQGSDLKENANVKRLKGKGVTVFQGASATHLANADFVVISTAVKDGNIELEAAREKGLPVIRRAEMLAELMRLYSSVSVTGTHGKTTTTSMIAHVFEHALLDPTVITGGIINAWGSNARLGKGRWMIVEADESDGTFVKLPTEIGVVTNIDPEHLDYFGTVQAMHRDYESFYKNIPFYGLAVTCIDHPVVADMIERTGLVRDGKRLLTYGSAANADLRLLRVETEGGTITFDAQLSGNVKGGPRVLKDWSVPMPGHHNALNALAAIAVATEAGIPDDVIQQGLMQFSGIKRRFQQTGLWNGVTIYDDYAHHPAEITAVLSAAKAGTKGRVFAIMEPHRYTRVRDLFADFSQCFKDADNVVVAPLYSAGESPIEGISPDTLAQGIRKTGHSSVAVVADAVDVGPLIQEQAREGDIVIYLGAGNSTEWAYALPTWLNANEPRRAGAAQ